MHDQFDSVLEHKLYVMLIACITSKGINLLLNGKCWKFGLLSKNYTKALKMKNSFETLHSVNLMECNDEIKKKVIKKKLYVKITLCNDGKRKIK